MATGKRDLSGPDMQEGPHSILTEEEWFDAITEADARRASVDRGLEEDPYASPSASPLPTNADGDSGASSESGAGVSSASVEAALSVPAVPKNRWHDLLSEQLEVRA